MVLICKPSGIACFGFRVAAQTLTNEVPLCNEPVTSSFGSQGCLKVFFPYGSMSLWANH